MKPAPVEQRAGHEQWSHAHARDQHPGDDDVDRDQRDREGKPGDAGLHGAVSPHRLHVEGEEEEHGEQRGAEEQHHDVGARAPPRAQQVQRQLGVRAAPLDEDEAREESGGAASAAIVTRVAPVRDAVLSGGGVNEAVDQQREAGRAGHDAGDVEAAAQPSPSARGRTAREPRRRSPIGALTKSTQRHDT